MRISANHPNNAADADGNPVITTSDYSVLVAHASPDARGRMGYGEVDYGQYREDATDLGGNTASWEALGDFPAEMVALFTQRELSLTSPNAQSPAEVDVWGRWAIPLSPSELLGGPDDEVVLLPWVSSPGEVASRGLFAPPTDAQPVVRVGNGAAWVMVAGGLTCLDFATDLVTFYQESSGRTYDGSLLPGTIPDDPYGAALTEYACSAMPYRGLSLHATRTHSWACAVGGARATLLRKDLGVGGVRHYPVEHFDFVGFAPTDVTFLSDGSIVVVGTRPNGDGDPVGTLGWMRRAAVTSDLFGAAAWEGPFFGPEEFDQFTPRIARDGRWIWISSGEGHIWRLSEPETTLTAAADIEYWAGPRSPDLEGNLVEPKYDSIYQAAAIAGLEFDDGLPVILLVLSAAQGGGSILCTHSYDFSRVLWRRYYPRTMTGIARSPMQLPASTPVTVGQTGDPAVGYGPDDTEV